MIRWLVASPFAGRQPRYGVKNSKRAPRGAFLIPVEIAQQKGVEQREGAHRTVTALVQATLPTRMMGSIYQCNKILPVKPTFQRV